MQEGIAVKGHGGIDEGAEIEIRLDAALAYERDAFLEHRGLGCVTPDRRDQ